MGTTHFNIAAKNSNTKQKIQDFIEDEKLTQNQLNHSYHAKKMGEMGNGGKCQSKNKFSI